jgi:hypothetical protein
MPDNIRELNDFIWSKTTTEQISNAAAFFAVGWILSDIFERCDHEEKEHQAPITAADIDKFVRDLPLQKIERDMYEAQQQFGRDAASFMEPEIQRRIEQEIDRSVVKTIQASSVDLKGAVSQVAADVRTATSGWKAFGMNVIAGVIAGVIFAATSFGLYEYVKVDPSLNNIGKTALGGNP